MIGCSDQERIHVLARIDAAAPVSSSSVTRAVFSRKPKGKHVEKAKLFCRYAPRRGKRTSTVSSSVSHAEPMATTTRSALAAP